MPGGNGYSSSGEEVSVEAEARKDKLPECPFNGVIIAVDNKAHSSQNGYTKTYTTLAIMRDDEMGDESDEVYFHCFVSSGPSLDPRAVLREGHRVKIRKVQKYGKYFEVQELDFDPVQLIEEYRKKAALKRAE